MQNPPHENPWDENNGKIKDSVWVLFAWNTNSATAELTAGWKIFNGDSLVMELLS